MLCNKFGLQLHDKKTNVGPEAPLVVNHCFRVQCLAPICRQSMSGFEPPTLRSFNDNAEPTEPQPLGHVWHLTTVQLLPPSSQRDIVPLTGCGIGIVTGATQVLASFLGAQVKQAVAEAQNIEGFLETVLSSQDFFFLSQLCHSHLSKSPGATCLWQAAKGPLGSDSAPHRVGSR